MSKWKSRKQKWIERLERLLQEERQKAKGYNQLSRIHGAYISILLKKLGATKDNPISVTSEEVKEALEKSELRAIKVDGGFGLYCEDISKE